MLLFFPTPYPDELMYGVFSRYHKVSGNISKYHTLEELFGDKNNVAAIEFPSRLSYLCSNLPYNTIYNEEYLIYEHTIFSLYKPFISIDKAKKVINDMKGAHGKAIHMRLGIMAGGISRTKSLKVCSSCKDYDENIYGEAYFHRLHQIPGNYICLKHKEFLKQYNIPFSKSNAEFININDIEISSLVGFNLENYYTEFYKLSKDIELVTFNNLKNKSISNIYRKYLFMLNTKGYVSPKGRVNHRKLYKDFIKFYPEEFLQILESDIAENDMGSWLRRIAARNKEAIDPIRHLLFIRFLFGSMEDFINLEEEDYHPFGKKPWPCLNPVSDHYKKDVIDICEISTDCREGRPVGKFTCSSCGFAYCRRGPDLCESDRYRIGNKKQFGHIWEAELKRMVISRRITVKQMSRELHCDEKTVVKYAEKLKIDNYLNTNIKAYPTKNIGSKYHAELEKPYKQDILNLIKKHPNDTRTQIRNKAQKQYSWLFTHEREWMEDILPSPLNNFSRPSSKIIKIDWELRDNIINEKVKKAIVELLEEEKPRRLTLSLISRKIEYSSLYHQLEKLPNTKLTLKNNLESTEEFQIRRVNITVANLLDEGSSITKNKIVQLAGLSRRTDKLDEIIEDIVKSYNK